jgi:predicted nucleic acid-binding protein
MTIVDTCIWSLIFRRRNIVEDAITAEFRRLMGCNDARLLGPVRQELLSGIREPSHFAAVKQKLTAYADTPVEKEVYERAAEFACICRRAGLAHSPTDMLICAAAEHYQSTVFTADRDFERYARVIPISFHPVS